FLNSVRMAASIQLSPESLCDRLDHLSIQRLELMDKLIRSNMLLEECMRSGFFLLGKTRYSLGTKAVSSLQLPKEDRELDALTKVVTDPIPLEGYDGEILFQQVDIRFQDPIITVDEKEPPEDDFTDVDDMDDGMHGLRRRRSGLDKETENNNNSSSFTNGNKIKTLNRDPIRWFSVLPPQTLRQAQVDFKRALQVSTQCATIQIKLRAVIKEYKRLTKIKEKLERLEKEP
ncbi:hypothetical protein SK128_012055, partial [Halocaridina rubra]